MSYVPPKKNAAFITYVSLEDQANAGLFKASPTLAAGDFKVSIDGGSLTNLTDLPTVTPAAGRMVKITLTAAEMNGDNITVVCVDAAGAEWYDLMLNIQTSARQIDDLATPTNITAGTITTVTNLTNLPAAAALEATLTTMKGATFSGATDSMEAISEAVAGVGAGNSDWTADEREQIRYRLQLDGTQTAPADTDLPAVNLTQWKGAAPSELLSGLVQTHMIDLGGGGGAADAVPGLFTLGQSYYYDDGTKLSEEGRQNVRDAMKLAPTAGAPDADSVDDKLNDILASGGGLTAQETRDAMKLAPTAGDPAAGSVDKHLDDILEDTGTTLPGMFADLPTASEIDTQLSGVHGAGAWGGSSGAGSSTGYYTDTVNDGTNPLDGVRVQLYTAPNRVGLAYEAYTNALGVFEMWPDPGTYYRWLDLSGYNGAQDVEVTVTEP